MCVAAVTTYGSGKLKNVSPEILLIDNPIKIVPRELR